MIFRAVVFALLVGCCSCFVECRSYVHPPAQALTVCRQTRGWTHCVLESTGVNTSVLLNMHQPLVWQLVVDQQSPIGLTLPAWHMVMYESVGCFLKKTLRSQKFTFQYHITLFGRRCCFSWVCSYCQKNKISFCHRPDSCIKWIISGFGGSPAYLKLEKKNLGPIDILLGFNC